MRLHYISTFTALAALSNVQGYVRVPGVKRRAATLRYARFFAVTRSSSDDSFIAKSLLRTSECDNVNTPPSLSILLRSLDQLPSGTDIRGRFVDHSRVGSIANVAHAIGAGSSGIAPLTPIAAYCLGHAFARMLQERCSTKKEELTVALGTDPRPHGMRLCDAFARGVLGYSQNNNIKVDYTGLATTPSMFEFCRSNKCDGAVMVTASHLPVDRNGFKFVTRQGGFTKTDLLLLVEYAKEHAQYWHDQGVLPPTSGKDAVFCSEWVSCRERLPFIVANDLDTHACYFLFIGGPHAALCIHTQECHSQRSRNR